MINANDYFDIALKFHGHKCPAMPLGLRAGAAALHVLHAERAQDKELQLICETGKGHAAGCFLDGLMVATGCTYGKSNIEKTYYNKMAFTLIDVARQKSVRISLKPEFFARMLQSPFVAQRKQGVPPQDVPAAIADPLVEKVMSMPEDDFLHIEPVRDCKFSRSPGVFEAQPCSRCGEMTFVDKLTVQGNQRLCSVCLKDTKGQD